MLPSLPASVVLVHVLDLYHAMMIAQSVVAYNAAGELVAETFVDDDEYTCHLACELIIKRASRVVTRDYREDEAIESVETRTFYYTIDGWVC